MKRRNSGTFELGRTVVVRCRRRDGANEHAVCGLGTVRSHRGTTGRLRVISRSYPSLQC